MQMEQHQGPVPDHSGAFNECIEDQEEGPAEHLQRHIELLEEWLQPSRIRLQISESWLKRLALVATFSRRWSSSGLPVGLWRGRNGGALRLHRCAVSRANAALL